jgi:catechol 2,3-dioxygenase-like lactoylglutathione lyase family enzyme
MPTRFSHTNIVSRDPERLAGFYTKVFGCEQSGPVRELVGEWLGRGMGLPGARVHGYHLTLPGVEGAHRPTLEIFSLDEIRPTETDVTQSGLMHIAFSVDDIDATIERFLAAGGSMQGERSHAEVSGVGNAYFAYMRDPDNNIVELQQWEQ